jgi:hypothetical protein
VGPHSLIDENALIDELVIATSVLAGFTAVLAGATIAYAWYTRQQVKLLKLGHELTKQRMELMRKQVVTNALVEYHVHNVPFVLNKDMIANKIKELDLE